MRSAASSAPDGPAGPGTLTSCARAPSFEYDSKGGRAVTADGERTRRFVVVSTDSHVGAKSLADFEPYVDAAYRERLASLYGMSTELRLPGMMYGPADPQVNEEDPVRRAVIRLMLRWGVPEERVRECAPAYS